MRWAERLGLTELATYLSKDPTSANIYRATHNAAINRQLAQFEQAQAVAGGKPLPSPSKLSVLPDITPDDDGPLAALLTRFELRATLADISPEFAEHARRLAHSPDYADAIARHFTQKVYK